MLEFVRCVTRWNVTRTRGPTRPPNRWRRFSSRQRQGIICIAWWRRTQSIFGWNSTMQCIQINSFGRPWEIVEVVRQPDVGSLAAGEIVIEMEYSPINPSDVVLMRGFYGIKPELPALVGSEGVGRVVKVGSDIVHLNEGDRVLFPPGVPTWPSRSLVKPDAVFRLPP